MKDKKINPKRFKNQSNSDHSSSFKDGIGSVAIDLAIDGSAHGVGERRFKALADKQQSALAPNPPWLLE